MAEQSRRDRILQEAFRLFAERGYERTTVADIEAASGFSPGSGSLYGYFPSKQALFQAALESRMAGIDVDSLWTTLLPLGDVRAEATLIVRYLRNEVRSQQDLISLLSRESDFGWEGIDATFAGLFFTVISRLADWLEKHAKSDLAEGEAIGAAVALFGSVMAFEQWRVNLGEDVTLVSDDAYATALVRMIMGFLGDIEA